MADNIDIHLPDGHVVPLHNKAGRAPHEWTEEDADGFRLWMFRLFNPDVETRCQLTIAKTPNGDVISLQTENGTAVAGPLSLSRAGKRGLTGGGLPDSCFEAPHLA